MAIYVDQKVAGLRAAPVAKIAPPWFRSFAKEVLTAP